MSCFYFFFEGRGCHSEIWCCCISSFKIWFFYKCGVCLTSQLTRNSAACRVAVLIIIVYYLQSKILISIAINQLRKKQRLLLPCSKHSLGTLEAVMHTYVYIYMPLDARFYAWFLPFHATTQDLSVSYSKFRQIARIDEYIDTRIGECDVYGGEFNCHPRLPFG